jgi:DNA topoisomerase I
VDPRGRPVRDRAVLARIRSIAIPPAWTDVWICPRPDGHLQAVGRDARGRKQYRYHPAWRAVRERTKYDRMAAFAAALPAIRRRVRHDLRRPGLPREKVLATVVRLLELTRIRVGNAEYARQNGSYGLTTLRNRHVRVRGSELSFRFRGKSGQVSEVSVSDPRVARIVRRCLEIPGQELFQYADERGRIRSLGSGDVNEYLREIAGEGFTAKDFRTWAGSVAACAELARCEPPRSPAEAKRNVLRAVSNTADRLGNTPAVCRRSYVHPAVINEYVERRTGPPTRAGRRAGLTADEAAFSAVIRGNALAAK